MKGLIIRKRWLDKILGDTKSWEMRSQPTLYRGAIALICQGTGGQILGVADLVESLPALTETAFKETRGKHGIPPEDDARVLQDGWVYPWVIRNVRKLGTPVFSGQRPGQIHRCSEDLGLPEEKARPDLQRVQQFFPRPARRCIHCRPADPA